MIPGPTGQVTPCERLAAACMAHKVDGAAAAVLPRRGRVQSSASFCSMASQQACCRLNQAADVQVLLLRLFLSLEKASCKSTDAFRAGPLRVQAAMGQSSFTWEPLGAGG